MSAGTAPDEHALHGSRVSAYEGQRGRESVYDPSCMIVSAPLVAELSSAAAGKEVRSRPHLRPQKRSCAATLAPTLALTPPDSYYTHQMREGLGTCSFSMTTVATKTHPKTNETHAAKQPAKLGTKTKQLKWKPFKLNVKYNYEHHYGMSTLGSGSQAGGGGSGASYAPYEPTPSPTPSFEHTP